jgi:GxxExxY protein
MLDCGYRLDWIVYNAVVVEIKAVERILPVHEAQVITYLKIGGWTVGLLINSNVLVMKDAIKKIHPCIKE